LNIDHKFVFYKQISNMFISEDILVRTCKNSRCHATQVYRNALSIMNLRLSEHLIVLSIWFINTFRAELFFALFFIQAI